METFADIEFIKDDLLLANKTALAVCLSNKLGDNNVFDAMKTTLTDCEGEVDAVCIEANMNYVLNADAFELVDGSSAAGVATLGAFVLAAVALF